jgi:hypothetical protein
MQDTAGRAFAPAADSREERWNNVNETSRSTEEFLRRNAPQLGQAMPDRAGTVASRFPNEIEKGRPEDERYALKGKLLQQGGGAGPYIPGVGLAMATDSDFEYFRNKALDAQEADWKAWFLQQMDLSTPEKQAYWQANFPDVFQERQKLLEKQVKIQFDLARIRMLGPKNKEDYQLLWAIQRGFIKVPQGPLFDPTKLQQQEFHEGLLNIKKLFARSGTGRYGAYDPSTGVSAGVNSSAASTMNIDWKDPLSNVSIAPGQWYSGVTNFGQIGAQQ